MTARVPNIEADLGMELYVSEGPGISGKIRCLPEDFIVEEILSNGSKASIQQDATRTLLSGHGRYLVCLLVKKEWDTLIAVRRIADVLGIAQERIGVAGIKDAEALTAQHISIWGLPRERIGSINLKDITVKPIGFADREISSEILIGNHFTIVIKQIKYATPTIVRRTQRVRNELLDVGGVPNFFGHQRFGTVRPITHQIGRDLVKGDLESAARTFLSQPSPYEHPKTKIAREQLLETGDYRTALKSFPKGLIYERLMLKSLSKYPRDFLGAFNRLPSNLCRLFIQAYQSLLFNRVLSNRMKQNIPLREAQKGDYVVSLDEKGLPTNGFKLQQHRLQSIDEQIAARRMAIAIPLIGFRQSLSEGIQGDIERGMLEKEEIDPQDFFLKEIPKASASGGLRTMLAPILDLEIKAENDCESEVKISFTLHRGSYATVVLREFMKPKSDKELINNGF